MTDVTRDALGPDGRRRLHRLPGCRAGGPSRCSWSTAGCHTSRSTGSSRSMSASSGVCRATMRVLVFDKRGIGMSDRVVGSAGPQRAARRRPCGDGRCRRREGGPARLGRTGAGTRRVLRRDLPRSHTLPSPRRQHPRAARSPTTRGESLRRRSKRTSPAVPPSHGAPRAGPPTSSGYRVRRRAREPAVLPYNDPEFLRWNAKLARYAGDAGELRGVRAHVVRHRRSTPCCRAISAPTAVRSSPRTIEDDEAWRAQSTASFIPGPRRSCRSRRPPAVIWVPEPEPIVAAIERFIASVRQEEAELDRMLATVLFTDIVGSTDRACARRRRRLGGAAREAQHQPCARFLARYRGTRGQDDRRRLPRHLRRAGAGGQVRPGRSARRSSRSASKCAPAATPARSSCWAPTSAASPCTSAPASAALAGPSEVLVTSTVKDLVAGSGLAFDDRGEHHLKGVPDAWHLYALAASDIVKDLRWSLAEASPQEEDT